MTDQREFPFTDRRTFLSSLVAAVAGTAAVACSDGTSTTGSSTTVGSVVAPTAKAPASLNANPFGLGVASGDPLADSVILWTRLITDVKSLDGTGGMAPEDVDVVWEVSTDDSFTNLVAADIAKATASLGHSVHVDVKGLQPDSWYFYRFRVGSYTSPVGKTRTTPAPDANVDQLRFGFASCQDFDNGEYGAHATMAKDRLDLVFFLGDYIYESAMKPLKGFPAQPECTDLNGYRARYAIYKSSPALQASHAACPWVVTPDDHEVENNRAGLSSENKAPVAEFAKRTAAAYQAMYEHLPLRLDPPTSDSWKMYRSFSYGKLAEFFVLDGRQYRSDQPCNRPADAIVNRKDCAAEIDDPTRTMLGAEQEAWLNSGLQDASGTWRVLAQQTVMSSLVLGNIVLNVDQWDGYPAARQRLLGFIEDHKIDNVVVLTGDIHSAGAGVLFSVKGDVKTPVASEFVGTSITSASLVDIVPGGADLVTVDKFPGIEYLNVKEHGYTRCTVTASEWKSEFVMMNDLGSVDASSRVDATLVVKSGEVKMSKL